MTTNSINFNKHLEDKRANQAREVETNRSNLVQEAETKRHNLATEDIQERNLQELIRHQLASENISYSQLANALTVASIGAQGRISSAAIGAAASRYASDNAFAANMAATKQRESAAKLSADTSLTGISMQTSTSRDIAGINNAWNAYNVGRQIKSNEDINQANIEQRERQSKRESMTKFVTSEGNTIVGGALKFIPIGGLK